MPMSAPGSETGEAAPPPPGRYTGLGDVMGCRSPSIGRWAGGACGRRARRVLRAGRTGAPRGFTLIELLVVIAIVALASAAVTLAVRDPQATQLEREAARLSALLESARAEARASGLAVFWVPAGSSAGGAFGIRGGAFSADGRGPFGGGDVAGSSADPPVSWAAGSSRGGGTGAADAAPPDFRFVGLPPAIVLPRRWLAPGVSASVVGSTALRLGPEPLIPAQRVVLSLGSRRLVLATDGLAPFAVEDVTADGVVDALPSTTGG